MRTFLRTATTLCFAAILPMVPSNQSGGQNESAEILAATVRYLHGSPFTRAQDGTQRVLKVSPQALPDTGPVMARSTLKHAENTLAALNIDSISEVVSPERATQCAVDATDDCMTNGASIVVALSHPSLAGNSAIVRVTIRRSQKVSSQDSAAMVKAPGGQTRIRMTRGSTRSGQATLTRVNGRWTVQDFRTLAVSQ